MRLPLLFFQGYRVDDPVDKGVETDPKHGDKADAIVPVGTLLADESGDKTVEQVQAQKNKDEISRGTWVHGE